MNVRCEQRDGVAVLTLDRAPANALDEELVAGLRSALAKQAGARAILLTSALPSIFSAGWDVTVLRGFGHSRMRAFFDSYCDLVREIFSSPWPIVAALPGHAIAGGLIVAAAADERWACAGPGEFGLSEVLLGVPIPRCCLEIFHYAIGSRAAERLAATGENLSAPEAARIGLLDRVVAPHELFDRALDRAHLLAERDLAVYDAIRRDCRAAALAAFDQSRRDDPFLDFWFGDPARRRLQELVERLEHKGRAQRP